MEPLESRLDTASSEFAANRDYLQTLVDELKQRLASTREGGGAKYVARHREQGKMPVRERITALLDPDDCCVTDIEVSEPMLRETARHIDGRHNVQLSGWTRHG